MPDSDDDLFDSPQPKREASNKIVFQPAGAQWSLARLPEVESAYQSAFKRRLPLVNKGQGSIHNKWGLDHRESADVAINPATPEGQQFDRMLREKQIPFLAFTGPIPGVATSAHYHIGFPSHKTTQRFNVGAQRKSLGVASDDLFDSGSQQSVSDDDLFDTPSSPKPNTRSTVPSVTNALDKLTADVNRRVGRIKPQSPFTGVRVGVGGVSGQPAQGMGDLRRIDDQEVSRIQRIQKQVDTERAASRQTAYDNPGIMPTRPYMGQVDTNDEVLNRVAAERRQEAEAAKQAEWQTKNAQAIADQTAAYRADIQKSARLGRPALGLSDLVTNRKPESNLGAANKWLAELGTKGGAGFSEAIAGILKPVDPELANKLRIHVEAARRAAEEEGADRTATSKFVQDVVGGFIGSIPELAAMSAGVPAPVAFGAGSGARAYGGDRSVVPAVAHGAATGAAFEIPVAGQGIGRALKRAGTVGAATTGIDVAAGQPVGEALKSGAVNALMVGVPEIAGGRRSATQAETQHQGVESRSSIAEGQSASNIEAPADIATAGPISAPTKTAPRFQHVDFGEVEVTESQQGARAGRVRVAEVADPSKIHYIKKTTLQGRGNERAIPIRSPEPEAVPPVTAAVPPESQSEAVSPARQAASRPPADSILEHNRRQLESEDFKRVLMLESVGGNAGPNRAAVNMVVDRDGRIVAIGNFGVHSSRPDLRERVNSGELRDASAVVQYDKGLTNPRIERITGKGFPREMLERAVSEWASSEPDLPPASTAKVSPPERIERTVIYKDRTYNKIDGQWYFGRASMKLPVPELANELEKLPELQSKTEAASNVTPESLTKPSQAEQSSTGTGGGTPEEIPPRPSSTSARKQQFAQDRAELDLPELPPAERKKWQTTLNEAKEKGTHNAGILANEVLAKPRALNDTETAQLVLRAQEIKNEHSRVMREIGDSSDTTEIQAKTAQANALENEFDRLTRATKASGTEKGRALASQKLTINQNFDLVSMIQRAKAARGRDLQPEERAKIEGQAKQIEILTEKLAAAEEKVKSQRLQKEIDRVIRRGRRAETKAALDDEFAALKAQFAKAKAEMPRVQASGLAGLDPEGVFTKLIVKMAHNRVRAGTVEAEALVDEIHSFVKDHIEGITKRDVRDVISGYGMEPQRKQSEQAKQLAGIRSELKKLSAQEDIAAGKRLSPKDKARQTQLLKQETELRRRLSQRDFTAPEARHPPKYTKETFRLQKQINEIKAEYERARYRATRGVSGKIVDTVAGVGNVPKTLLSMGDLSALLRQGGYGMVTHPILSSKAAMDMLKSVTERGFANVESEIKNHPKFDEAKRNGVEFTGIDKDDPQLSHKEEGYLGSNFIDSAAKGRLNPLKAVKVVKDVSERTFVSFLDSQRMRLYDHQSDAIRGMKLTAEETAKALQAQAKLINMATGRGSLGQKGNQAAPLLNVAMFSPRLLASRVQILNKMLNPVAWANQPKGSRELMMKDNAKFLAFTAISLGLAKAAGLQVNLDPDDADFLKIKVGDTRYDHLTGLQQPMRFMYRMANAIRGGETYAGDTKSKILGDFARSKAAPGFGYVWDYTEGRNRLSGKKFEAGKDLARNLVPLPMQDFADAIKNDGALRGVIEAFPSILGVGTQTYKGGVEKPTTQAEKLARRMAMRKMPDQARDADQVSLDQTKANLRAKSRRGEDVSQELAALGASITPQQAKNILDARNKTRLQEDMRSLGAKDAIILWSVMTPGQQQETRSLLEHKATLIDHLKGDERADVQRRYDEAGIKAPLKTTKGFKDAFSGKFKNQFASP